MTIENDTTTETTAAANSPRARRANPATKPAFVAVSTAAPTSKSDTVIKLLLRAKGATPVELIAVTDWQPHSLRAFLSGLRKKGRSVIREARKNGDFAYRMVTDQPPASGVAVAATEPTGTEPTSATVDAMSIDLKAV